VVAFGAFTFQSFFLPFPNVVPLSWKSTVFSHSLLSKYNISSWKISQSTSAFMHEPYSFFGGALWPKLLRFNFIFETVS
jgi:hypothetical protein